MIRRADSGDRDAVLALAQRFTTSYEVEAAAFGRAWDALLSDDNAVVLVASSADSIIGYLVGFRHMTFFANGQVAWVEEVMVDETQRRSGLAGS